jgi:spermidine synthase
MELMPSIRRAAAAAGAAALLAQVVLLREILASSQGNELVLGLALALWLCLTGAASVLGARLAGTPAVAAGRLALLLSLSPVILLGSLWLTSFSSSNPLGQEPGLFDVLAVSSAALLPACALGGLSFAWAAAALSAKKEGASVYIAETVGAALAGLLFHFVLAERLHAAWILLLASSVSVMAGGALAWPRRWSAALGVLLLSAGVAGGPALERALTAARFPGQRVVTVEPSRYGLVAVVENGRGTGGGPHPSPPKPSRDAAQPAEPAGSARERDGQRVFFHDGVLLFTTEDQLGAEETTHLPLLLHPRPRRVLMVGGGLGGGLSQVLLHEPDTLDYAEMDGALLGLARRFADAGTRAALADARVHAAPADGRPLLRGATGRYDVILLNLPAAGNALSARFSTRECFEDARAALAPGGLLAFVTPGSDAYLAPAARQRHASVLATLNAVFPSVGVAPGAQTILWASEQAMDADPELLARRLGERGIHPLRIGRAWLFDRLMPLHGQAYRRSLVQAPGIENRDFHPIVYLFGLVESIERYSPTLSRLALARALWMRWLIPGGILLVAVLVLALRRGGRAPGFAAAASGAAGMAVEVVLLLAYQSLAGHLYHALGGMLAAFMAGMAAGAWLGRSRLEAPRALAWVCAVAAAVSLSVIPLLAVARSWPALATLLVFFGMLLAGATTGAVYPLAVAAAEQNDAVARVYAWDLAGSAGAALLVALVAVPLLGLFPVVGLAAALCAAAALANRRS